MRFPAEVLDPPPSFSVWGPPCEWEVRIPFPLYPSLELGREACFLVGKCAHPLMHSGWVLEDMDVVLVGVLG